MKKLYILLMILLVPLVVASNGDNLYYYFATGTMQLNGTDLCVGGACLSDAGGSYDLDVAGDAGTGSITNAETFTVAGAGTVSTAMAGNTLTITGAGGGGGAYGNVVSPWLYNATSSTIAFNYTTLASNLSKYAEGSHTVDTFNSTTDIQNVISASYIYTTAPHTNRSNADITSLCYDTESELYNAAPHTNRTDTEILGLFSSSDNVTITNGNVWLNLTWSDYCVKLTGGSSLCDGDDAVGGGGGGTSIWLDNGTFAVLNSTYATDVYVSGYLNTTDNIYGMNQWCNATTCSSYSDLLKDTDTDTNTWNSTSDITNVITQSYLYTTTPHTNRSDSDIKAQCYDTPAELYSAAPHTNRSDSDITNLAYNTAAELYTAAPHTNLSEDNVEAYIFDADNDYIQFKEENITGIDSTHYLQNVTFTFPDGTKFYIEYNGTDFTLWGE